jgi:catechol 2,3-dioxygenase-like lactoylglutathione lyase family enzyme
VAFRIEHFVDDVDASLVFYKRALGFRVVRREADYASLVLGDAVLGLAPIAKLPADAESPSFTRARLAGPPA